MKEKYSFKELIEMEELPLEIIQGVYNEKGVISGLEISIDAKTIIADPKKYEKIKSALHSNYSKRNTSWVGMHGMTTRRNFKNPEIPIVAAVLEAIQKYPISQKILLHRVFNDLKKQVELNPITEKDFFEKKEEKWEEK